MSFIKKNSGTIKHFIIFQKKNLTFVSAQHKGISSSTKENFFKSPFNIISYGKNSVISSSIQSWNNAQSKLGLLKTFPSANIKQLIADEILKNS